MMTPTENQPPPRQTLRRVVSVLAITIATCAAVAALIGLLDAALGTTEIGATYRFSGTVLAVIGVVVAGLAMPKGPRELRRLAIISFGVWPFAAFVLFIAWRIGVANVQAEACTAGDATACFTLAKRRDKRGRVDEARALFMEGCALGHALSCATLGFRGEAPGIDTDDVNAFLQTACEGDVAQACARLATRVEGVDPARAQALLRAGCAAGDASSCTRSEGQ